MIRGIRSELGLFTGMVTMALFLVFGESWLADRTNHPWALFLFGWLFIVMLWASFSVVRHADALAIKLGEPYGTLILTLSVIGIEVVMISAVMLTGTGNPTLGRDMMFSVVMIVMNGLVGLSLLLGGRRHMEQRYNLMGSSSYLAVWIPLAVLSLVLPNYTRSTPDGSYSTSQAIFLILATITLYGTFLVLERCRKLSFKTGPAGCPWGAGRHAARRFPRGSKSPSAPRAAHGARFFLHPSLD